MDKRDFQILKAIGKRGSPKAQAVKDETGIPKSTVHYRLQRMQERGIIKNELYDLDLKKIGLHTTVISEVFVEFGEAKKVGEQLREIEGVNQVYFTMGDTDFIVIAHLPNQEMVEDLLSRYEGIDELRRTSSKYVVTTVKNESYPLNDFSQASLYELCEYENGAEGQ